jgi:hypothetical protein
MATHSTVVLPFSNKYATDELLAVRPVIESLVCQVHEIMCKATRLLRIYTITCSRRPLDQFGMQFPLPPAFNEALVNYATVAVQDGILTQSRDPDLLAMRLLVESSKGALKVKRPKYHPINNPVPNGRSKTLLRLVLHYEARKYVTMVKQHMKGFRRMTREFINITLKNLTNSEEVGEGETPEERKRSRVAVMKEVKIHVLDGHRGGLGALSEMWPLTREWLDAHFEHLRPRSATTGDKLHVRNYSRTLTVLAQANPEMMLRPLVYMAAFLCRAHGSCFEILPQRTSEIPGFIFIDTGLLIQLLLGKAGTLDTSIWLRALLPASINKGRAHTSFAHGMSTDGVAMHLLRETKEGNESKVKLNNARLQVRTYSCKENPPLPTTTPCRTNLFK